MPGPLFRIYVDETGDRGMGGTSSPFFMVAAVIVEDSKEAAARAALAKLRVDLAKPAGTVLHWAQNIKDHMPRRHVARTLGGLDLTISYVIVDKASLAPGSLGHHAQMYHYAVRRLVERLSWFVRDRNGTSTTTLAHIQRFKYGPLSAYFNSLQSDPSCSIHWPSVATRRVGTPQTHEMLQWADIAAGALSSAVAPHPRWRMVEPQYLFDIESRLYRRPPGALTAYGLHVIHGGGGPTCLTSQPWWPQFPNK